MTRDPPAGVGLEATAHAERLALGNSEVAARKVLQYCFLMGLRTKSSESSGDEETPALFKLQRGSRVGSLTARGTSPCAAAALPAAEDTGRTAGALSPPLRGLSALQALSRPSDLAPRSACSLQEVTQEMVTPPSAAGLRGRRPPHLSLSIDGFLEVASPACSMSTLSSDGLRSCFAAKAGHKRDHSPERSLRFSPLIDILHIHCDDGVRQ